VRLKQWVDAFGSNGIFEQMCQDSYAPALQAIAGQIAKLMGPPCLDANLDPDRCTFVDHNVGADGSITSSPLPRCNAALNESCWDVSPDTSECLSGRRVIFSRVMPLSGLQTTTTATCSPK
jgi:hypothetical protein